MNIVIAPDSFKECLSATEVAKNIAKGILNVHPKAKITTLPISDGGEGLLESLVIPFGGKIISVKVQDPLERNINSHYGILKDGKTAVIELAKASGLELLNDEEKDPLITTTFGTGQLIKDALNKGCRKFIIGIGGSATNDGGAGIAKALGAKFLNANNEEIKQGGRNLNTLNLIDLSNFDEKGDMEYLLALIINCKFSSSDDKQSRSFGADDIIAIQLEVDNNEILKYWGKINWLSKPKDHECYKSYQDPFYGELKLNNNGLEIEKAMFGDFDKTDLEGLHWIETEMNWMYDL